MQSQPLLVVVGSTQQRQRSDQTDHGPSMTFPSPSQLQRRSDVTAAVDGKWQLGKMATNFELGGQKKYS